MKKSTVLNSTSVKLWSKRTLTVHLHSGSLFTMLTDIATSSEKYHIFVPMVDQFEVFIVFFLSEEKTTLFS